MSTVTPTAESLPLVLPYQPARWSVDEYHKLIADGTLTKNHRLELLKGVIVEKMTTNPDHSAFVRRIQQLIVRMLPETYWLRIQSPITLRDSEPEPDLAIVRPDPLEMKRHPGPADVLLVIEVSSSSLLTDRYKGDIYGEACIPFYWIVNLPARRVEVYSHPVATAEGLRYGEPTVFQPGEAVPVILDGQEIGSLHAEQILPTDAV